MNYELLVEAIIKRAISDYKHALKESYERGEKTSACWELESFFRSSWAEYLTGGNGIIIGEKIRKEMREKHLAH